MFCRSEKGEIYNLNPKSDSKFIDKGNLDFEIYKDVIDQTKDTLLMSVPYVNGEPFIYSKLDKVIQYSTDNNVATMMATNGILLTKKNAQKVLDAGLDFIKVHVSGYTNEIHQVQHRVGDVETIKKNLIDLSQLIKEKKYKIIVVIDYILYEHNKHELDLFKNFVDELGFSFNIRPGNPKGLEESEKSQFDKSKLPVNIPCDWLWKILTVNWNGDVLPCCDYVVWDNTEGYANFQLGKTNIQEIWNGEKAIQMRKEHRQNGRHNIAICEKCPRVGTGFKF